MQTTDKESLVARGARFFRSPFFPIFMIVFVDVLGLGITIPVLPLFAQEQFGASGQQVALFQSVYFAAQFIASPQLGRWSDRLGRRPVLLLSQLGTFAALLVSGSAVVLPMLYIARIIDGFTGGNVSVAQAYLSDITTEKNRAQGIGIANAAFSTGFLFGPAFGALLAAEFGPRVPYFVAAAISLITIGLTYFLLPESLTAERRAAVAAQPGAKHKSRLEMLRLPGMPLLMAIAFGSQLSFFAFQSTYVLWAEKALFAGYDTVFVQRAVGYILTYVGAVGILTQAFLVKPVVSRFGERAMVSGGLAIRSVAFGTMAALPIVALVPFTTPLISFGTGMFAPGFIALVTYLSPPDGRGYAIGLAESVQGLGRISGPLLAGWLLDNVSPGAPLAMASLMGFMSAAVGLWLWRLPLAKPAAPGAGKPA